MNTTIPFPLLKKPGVRDPLACLSSFLKRITALALRRGDHGSVLEHKVLGRFVAAESELRDAGAESVRLIARKLEAAQAYYADAVADGQLTAAEDKAYRAQIDALYAQLAELGKGLQAPACTA